VAYLLKGKDPVEEDLTIKRKGFYDSRYENYLTRRQSYIFETQKRLDQIKYRMDSVISLEEVISKLKTDTKLNGPSLSQSISMHIELYYLNIIAIRDRVFRLVSHVYDLGLEKNVFENALLSNLHIKNTETAIKVKKLSHFLQEDNRIRNMISHESSYSDYESELEDTLWGGGYLSSLSRMEEFSLGGAHLDEEKLKEIDAFVKRYLEEKVGEMGLKNKVIFKLVDEVTESLDHEYEAKKESHIENPRK